MNFILGGSAAMCACLLTNPFEVIKVRLQLQGELKPKGKYPIYYKGVLHGLKTIIRHEGFLALYKGIIPALWNQFIYYGCRLGVVSTADNYGLLRASPTSPMELFPCIFFATIGSTAGTLFSSPFLLMKIQMQSKCAPKIAVGHQHINVKGMVSGLRDIVRMHGIVGLYSGLIASLPKTILGTAIQMTIYAEWEYFTIERKVFKEGSLFTPLITTNVTAILAACAISPLDVCVTRICNQVRDRAGNGILYENYFGTFKKVLRMEGLSGFYKGFVPCFIRIGPHTSILLLFFALLKDASTGPPYYWQ